MKIKNVICLAVLLIPAALNLHAQQGGYKGPGTVAITVADAKGLRDDTPVILQGRVERFLGDEKYLFSDESGNIIIEIDDRLWGNLSIDQSDTVEITGEIDKGFRELEVEVKAIKKL